MNEERQLFKFYRSYFAVAQELPDADRLLFYDAIMRRQFLGEEPKLKGIAKLAYVSQKYNIDSQVKGWEDKMGFQLSENHPITGGSVGGMAGGIEPPSIQEEEKEKEKEEVKEYNMTAKPSEPPQKKYSDSDFKKDLISLGVSDEVASDWMQVRKKARAVNTETAMLKIKSELSKCKLTPNDAIKKAVEKSWRGFENQWIENEHKQKGQINYDPRVKLACDRPIEEYDSRF